MTARARRKPRTQPHAVVLLSGGMDSAVALAIARREGFACHALSFDYGQRHRHELKAAARVARALGVMRHVVLSIDLRAIGGSALTDEIAVPKDRLDGPEEHRSGPGSASRRRGRARASTEIPVTYVPARNTIFLSCALGFAETSGARDIFIGVNAIDYSGYPDCRPEFVKAFERMANLATRAGVEDVGRGGHFRIRAPLERMTKADIVRTGVELGVDFSLTHSCYDPRPRGQACGHCDACVLRARGFAECGMEDGPSPAPRGKAARRAPMRVRTYLPSPAVREKVARRAG